MTTAAIPSRVNLKIVIDANELITILDSESATRDLIDWAQSRAVMLFVPMMAIGEIFPPKAAANRLLVLAQITKALAPRLKTAAGIIDAIRVEQDREQDGVVEGTLRFEQLEPRPGRMFKTLVAAFERQFREIKDLKLTQYERERALSRSCPGLDASVVTALLNSTDSSGPVEYALMALRGEGVVRHSTADILNRPSRFPVLHLFAHLLFRQAWANTLPSGPTRPSPNEHILGLFRTKSHKKGGLGAWADVSIAATAAKSDIFVSNDIGLAARCEFLRARGVVRFKTSRMDELIGGSNPANPQEAGVHTAD